MKDPQTAYLYAKHVLKHAWPEAEPYIKRDSFWHKKYNELFDL